MIIFHLYCCFLAKWDGEGSPEASSDSEPEASSSSEEEEEPEGEDIDELRQPDEELRTARRIAARQQEGPVQQEETEAAVQALLAAMGRPYSPTDPPYSPVSSVGTPPNSPSLSPVSQFRQDWPSDEVRIVLISLNHIIRLHYYASI